MSYGTKWAKMMYLPIELWKSYILSVWECRAWVYSNVSMNCHSASARLAILYLICTIFSFFLNCLFTYINKYGSYMGHPKIFFKIEIKWFFLTCLWQPDIINWILIFSFFLSEYKYTALHILFKKKGSAVHHEENCT